MILVDLYDKCDKLSIDKPNLCSFSDPAEGSFSVASVKSGKSLIHVFVLAMCTHPRRKNGGAGRMNRSPKACGMKRSSMSY